MNCKQEIASQISQVPACKIRESISPPFCCWSHCPVQCFIIYNLTAFEKISQKIIGRTFCKQNLTDFESNNMYNRLNMGKGFIRNTNWNSTGLFQAQFSFHLGISSRSGTMATKWFCWIPLLREFYHRPIVVPAKRKQVPQCLYATPGP